MSIWHRQSERRGVVGRRFKLFAAIADRTRDTHAG